MPVYRVMAVSDISQPQNRSSKQSTGRILETAADEDVTVGVGTIVVGEGRGDVESGEKVRCLKLVLAPETAPAPLVVAFELEPLPFAITQLLGAAISVDGAETRHGILLLTRENTRLAALQTLPQHATEAEYADVFILDEKEIAELVGRNNTQPHSKHDVYLIE